jgi:hypothetical protein
MAVSQCPICKEFLVGYNWSKTPKGKNWLQHKEKGWHNCPKNKFVKKTASAHKKKGKKGEQGLDLFPKQWDSDEAGYYCSRGHFNSPTQPKENYCVVCDTPLTCMFFEREKHL